LAVWSAGAVISAGSAGSAGAVMTAFDRIMGSHRGLPAALPAALTA
jgi:hypothetical protein